MTRRLNFLQYILKEKEHTLIHSFLVAQIENPLKGDWWELVRQDMMELNLNLSLSEIRQMSKEMFKNKVKTHVNEATFVWLSKEKQRSKKIQNLEHSKLYIQNYLLSEKLSVRQRKFLTHLRGKMVKVKTNFSRMYDNVFCSLCFQPGYESEDSQEHLLQCISLCNSGDIDTGTQYTDIFSETPEKFEKITLILEQKLRLRDKMILITQRHQMNPQVNPL